MPSNRELDRFLVDVGLSVLNSPAENPDINDSVVIRSLGLLIASGIIDPNRVNWDSPSADAIKEAIAESWESYSEWSKSLVELADENLA